MQSRREGIVVMVTSGNKTRWWVVFNTHNYMSVQDSLMIVVMVTCITANEIQTMPTIWCAPWTKRRE